jgi:hypothetical protein
MIEIGPETLAQAKRLDLAATEPDELWFFLCTLAPKLWQCVKASIPPLIPAKVGIQWTTLQPAWPRWVPAFAGTSGYKARAETHPLDRRLQRSPESAVDSARIAFENLGAVGIAQARRLVDVAFGVVEVEAGFRIDAFDRADHL